MPFCAACGAEAKSELRIGTPTGPITGDTTLESIPRLTAVSKAMLAQGSSQSERRIVSILFADVSGFTAMSEHMEAEEVTEVMNLVFDSLTAVIVDAGGTIDKYIGDCVMALFGAPRAHGDDAQRAVRAGIGMQAALIDIADALEGRIGTRLAMRVGINTGRVIAGEVGGHGHRRYTVMGDAVNVANRLESVCETGRVLISSATARFASKSFDLEPAGDYQVKGRQQPVPAFFAIAERTGASLDQNRFFEGVEIPFVGRGDLLDTLVADAKDSFDHATGPLLSLVHGPSGCGKSRLVFEVLRHLETSEAQDPLVLSLRSSAAGGEGEVAGLTKTLGAHLEARYGDAATGLSRLFGSGNAEDDLHLAAGLCLERQMTGSGHADPDTLWWSLRCLLEAISRERALILVFDDEDAGDDELWRFFTAQLPSFGGGPFWVLAEAQVEEAPSALVGQAWARTYALPPLTNGDIDHLLTGVLGACADVPPWLTSWVLPQSEGNPLYAIEHLRTLRHREILEVHPASGVWSLPSDAPEADALPATVEAAFLATLDHLPDSERSPLTAAAVVGRTFWGAVLASLDGTGQSEVALGRLVQRDFLQLTATGSIGGKPEYRFASDTLHRICMETFTVRDRQELHRKVALALERAAPEMNRAIAEHWTAAGERYRALPYLVTHGLTAIARNANEEAASTMEEVLAYEAGDGGDPAVLAGYRVDALLCLTTTHRSRGDNESAQTTANLAQGELDAEESIAGSTQKQAKLKEQLGRIAAARGDFEKALDHYQGCLDLCETADSALNMEAAGGTLWSLMRLKRLDEGQRFADALNLDLSHAKASAADASARFQVLSALGELARQRGLLAEALDFHGRSRELVQRSGNLHLQATADTNIAAVAASAGDWAVAVEGFSSALRAVTALGQKEVACINQLNLAECLLEMGRPTDAAEHLDGAESTAREMEAQWLLDVAAGLREKL